MINTACLYILRDSSHLHYPYNPPHPRHTHIDPASRRSRLCLKEYTIKPSFPSPNIKRNVIRNQAVPQPAVIRGNKLPDIPNRWLLVCFIHGRSFLLAKTTKIKTNKKSTVRYNLYNTSQDGAYCWSLLFDLVCSHGYCHVTIIQRVLRNTFSLIFQKFTTFRNLVQFPLCS